MGIASTQSEAVPGHSSPPPARDCGCGLSAFYAPPLDGSDITGVISVSGRAILHCDWLRVEFARVECLALGEDVALENRRFVENLAEAWGVPILGSGQLAGFARTLGNEVPRLIRPRREMTDD